MYSLSAIFLWFKIRKIWRTGNAARGKVPIKLIEYRILVEKVKFVLGRFKTTKSYTSGPYATYQIDDNQIEQIITKKTLIENISINFSGFFIEALIFNDVGAPS